MRDDRIPKELEAILRRFEDCFTKRSFKNFVTIVIGWTLCTGRRTLSRVVMASGAVGSQHFSTLYRFFSRAVWEPDAISRVLVGLIVERLGRDIEVSVDDTLCRRGGSHIFGAGMHHDSQSSSYGGAGGRTTSFAFGHNWVVFAIRMPMPWDSSRSWALPVYARLYRSKKICPKSKYLKRTEIARQMIAQLRSWIPADKRILLVGDTEYSCCTLVGDLPEGVDFTGSAHMEAALHEPVAEYGGKGRPRKKGARELSPRERFERKGGKWTWIIVEMYGRSVSLQIKTYITRWTKVTGARPVMLVLTRDPSGRLKDRAYFTTDLQASVTTVLQRIARRWLIEVVFRNAKQLFGLGHAQNGWWKKKRTTRRSPKKAGPQPRGTKGEHAIRRTAPMAWFVYSITVLYYFDAGRHEQDVQRSREAAPWYTRKTRLSIQDMLGFVRGQLLVRRLSKHPGDEAECAKLLERLPNGLLAA